MKIRKNLHSFIPHDFEISLSETLCLDFFSNGDVAVSLVPPHHSFYYGYEVIICLS